ncbi:hypothetical protein D3C72_2473520 [compost metagenome]
MVVVPLVHHRDPMLRAEPVSQLVGHDCPAEPGSQNDDMRHFELLPLCLAGGACLRWLRSTAC